MNFVDTAASYGPNVSENLIREALHRYRGMLVATKGALNDQGQIYGYRMGGRRFFAPTCKKA